MKRSTNRPDVGVRDLKAHASEMMRCVAEQHATYVVTRRGRPVGLLTPMPAPAEAPLTPEEAWDRLEKLGGELNRAWKTRRTSTTAIAGMRR
jgi:prevent-host-death family protein